jgi:hypothetical protein
MTRRFSRFPHSVIFSVTFSVTLTDGSGLPWPHAAAVPSSVGRGMKERDCSLDIGTM